ncbi:MlaD family protein [Gordonia zhaorongruii]|uniref:MlaD family protein n=1 Tax=Gordonia zhaorongruii TaxID=2597659 RepID=UPI00104CBEDB|nr:MlaD family protein [Gordonia zhaorongruii]
MRSTASATKRLLLVLVVVILAVYAIVQAINRPVPGDAQTYQAEFTDSFGLRENGDVRVRGVMVGKIVDIELQRSGVARVTFTVRNQDRLTQNDHLAIRFQNLVGQRYLAILDRDEAKGGQAHSPNSNASGDEDVSDRAAAPPLDPAKVIPASETTGSFDITRLFNGLRPILQGADPAVFNTFADNMIHLLQGENGVGIGDVLKDVERLSSFATDKNAMIRVLVDNLGVIAEQLKGKASIIKALMDNMKLLFDTLETNLELLKGAFGEGARVFPPIVESMKHVFDLSLGGHDRVQARLMELVPDTGKLADALKLIPTTMHEIDRQMDSLGLSCSNGEVSLPPMGDVLLSGGTVTLCKG